MDSLINQRVCLESAESEEKRDPAGRAEDRVLTGDPGGSGQGRGSVPGNSFSFLDDNKYVLKKENYGSAL